MHQTVTPTKSIVTVFFKPKDIPPYNASETKSVTFTIAKSFDELQRRELYKKGQKQVVNQDILDKTTLKNHWEPYDISIEVPEQPPELVEVQSFTN